MKKSACSILLLAGIALNTQAIIHGRGKIAEDAGSTVTQKTGGGGTPELPTTPGWTKLTGTTLKGGSENATPCPANNFNGYGYSYADSCQNVYNAWNSAVADLNRNRLIIWGGGHADYGGNEIYSLELSTNPPELIRLNAPSPPNNTTKCVETLADGRPNSRHTYDGLAFLPKQDVMLSQSGSLNYCGFSTDGTWTLSLSSVGVSCAPNCTPVWTKRTPATQVPSGYDIIMAYDTVNNLVWANDQNHGLYSYDPIANNWTRRFALPVGDTMHGTGVHDPINQHFINVATGGGDRQNIVYFNTAMGSSHGQNNPGLDASCSAMNNGMGYPGLAWDPIDKLVVVYPNAGNVLYLLDPKTWKCTTEIYGGSQGTDYPQGVNSGGHGSMGRFNYFPSLDVYVLCNDPNNDCWLLRRKRRAN
jgi:hypothetical protein